MPEMLPVIVVSPSTVEEDTVDPLLEEEPLSEEDASLLELLSEEEALLESDEADEDSELLPLEELEDAMLELSELPESSDEVEDDVDPESIHEYSFPVFPSPS